MYVYFTSVYSDTCKQKRVIRVLASGSGSAQSRGSAGEVRIRLAVADHVTSARPNPRQRCKQQEHFNLPDELVINCFTND